MYSIAVNMSAYGTVTMPDLPGFGGMDSFYSIGQTPTLDAMADYLATFIKLHYKKRPITIGAMSWGFLVTTKMLQKYPEIAKQVNLLISMVGFAHYSDFKFSDSKRKLGVRVAKGMSNPVMSSFFKGVMLRPFMIKAFYRAAAKKHPKMKDADKQELTKRVNFEVVLWRSNDVRTYFYTNGLMFSLNLVTAKVNLPVVHVRVDTDQYFNNDSVQRHLKQIYSDVKSYKAHLPNHAPTVVDDPKEAGAILPPAVRKMLAKKPGLGKV